jgi:pyridoxal 5'-phosphate synthase pdxT subunit
MKVGVLALQGDVPEHLSALARHLPHVTVQPVRQRSDLEGVAALFLPGGESTTIARLLADNDLWNPLATRMHEGLPVLATCAGFILLATRLEPSPAGKDPPTMGILNVTIRRNDFGGQRESFEGPVRITGLTGPPFPGVFIRAPRILSVGGGVTPIAWWRDEMVGVRSGRVWGLTFHPELSGDPRVHRRFLETAVG